MRNFLYSVVTILSFFIIFFSTLNYFLSGTPLFKLFGLNMPDTVFISKNNKESQTNKAEFNKENIVIECGKTEDGFNNLTFKKDIYGFRENNENLFYETDVLIIGDSFGISHCMNYPNDLTTQLKNINIDKKFLNISQAGSGPYIQKEILINLLNKTNTNFNTFIWLFYEGNDHEDLIKNYGNNLNLEFKINSNITSQITDQTKVIYKPSNNIFILKIKLFFANYFRGFGTLLKYFKNYPELLENEFYYESVVNDVSVLLSKKSVKKKFIFYIPKYTRLSFNKTNHPQITQLDNLKFLVKTISDKYEFEFIDGSDIYHNRKKPLDVFHYYLPTHFNSKGYKILANELSKLIDK
tara:strand:- start:67 stop:1125 length:1059 start_codon:yes stop_codon:yes gene_type:complete